MLTKTGDNLVSDVKTCLEFIGFEQVRDVDREIKHKSQTSRKQEDLQIHDRSPILLLEVKGLSGLPRESDILQVVKYIPRIKSGYLEEDVQSLKVDNQDVEDATKGQSACIKTEYKKDQLSKGSIVCMILKKEYP